MSDQELVDQRRRIDKELARRATMRTGAGRIESIVREVLDAEGVQEGDPWRQPTGYADVYPKGWTVTHDGKTWVSLIDGNSLEPGVSGWREVAVEGGDPPEYVPPAGYQDAYNTGDRVTFQGAVYECLSDGVTWSPAEAPQHWKKV